jgi:valyl-tRNA synthetase
VLTGPDGGAKTETRAMVAWVRDEILKLLHPFMPFVTEELWAVTASAPRANLLALSEWPAYEGMENPEAEDEIGWIIDHVTLIRSIRSALNIPGAMPLTVFGTKKARSRAKRWDESLKRLAKLSSVEFSEGLPKGSVPLLVRGETAASLPIADLVDVVSAQSRLEKELAKVDADIKRVDAKLGNPEFVRKAPEEIIEGEKEKREEAEERRAKILEALERLKGAA